MVKAAQQTVTMAAAQTEQQITEIENQDGLAPLPDIKTSRRRSSAFLDDYSNPSSLPCRIMRHWAPQAVDEDESEHGGHKKGHQVHFGEDFDDLIDRSGRGGLMGNMSFAVPKFAMPRRISIDAMQEMLNECVSETASRRESMNANMTVPDAKGGSRRASIIVRRPSMDVIRENAGIICSAINEVIEEREKAQRESEEMGTHLMNAETIAVALDDKLPDCDILEMDEDIICDDFEEPTEELTVEDAKDTWGGMLDTSAPPRTAAIPSERPIERQVSEAITDITDTLANLEQDVGAKLSQLGIAGAGETTKEIQDELSEFVSKLNEKLSENKDTIKQEIVGNEERSAKAQLLREEQDRLEQLREEQAMLKAQKEAELAAAEAAAAAVQPEEVETDEEEKPSLNIPEAIIETTEVTEVVEKPDKKDKKKKKDSSEKKKKKKKKEENGSKKKGEEGLARRRKTSTGRKLSRLRTAEGMIEGPEQTPAPDKSISVDEFLQSAGCGRPKAVLKYIMDGGDVNKQDEHKRTALQKACLYGEVEIIDVLLAKKAKLNLSDKLGDTALHWASRGGHPEVIQKLVKSGCKINAKDKLFSTPLHVGVRCGVQEVVEKLIELGANIDARDKEGDTPMHDAVRLGRFKLIKTLLSAGANLRAKNISGKTPIDMVQLWYEETKSHHAEIILQALTTAPPPQRKMPDAR